MTGTGATVFAPLSTREQAVEIARSVPPPWRGLAAQGMNRSPLLDFESRPSKQSPDSTTPVNLGV